MVALQRCLFAVEGKSANRHSIIDIKKIHVDFLALIHISHPLGGIKAMTSIIYKNFFIKSEIMSHRRKLKQIIIFSDTKI